MTEIASSPSPLILPSPRGPDDYALAETKLQLTLFVDGPPGPKTVARMFDLYFGTWGDSFRQYCSTDFGSWDEDWDAAAKQRFFSSELPALRRGRHWGYAFSDGRKSDARTLMFHGYRPFGEGSDASFYSFDFEWQTDPQRLKSFAMELLGELDCLSGSLGYAFRPHPVLRTDAYDQIYAWSRRYWGIDVRDNEVSSQALKRAYKCVSWITVLGDSLALMQPDALANAQAAAFDCCKSGRSWLLQAAPSPSFGDRHRGGMPEYAAIAAALLPLQVVGHGPFGDGSSTRWTEESTEAWLHRFTDAGSMT